MIPSFSVISSTSTPLLGQNTAASVVDGTDYSGILFWSPIPYEFLYQDVTTSQVVITSNG